MNTKDYFFLQSAESTCEMPWMIPFGLVGNNAKTSESTRAKICQFDLSHETAVSGVDWSAGKAKRENDSASRNIATIPAIKGLKRIDTDMGLLKILLLQQIYEEIMMHYATTTTVL